MARFAQVGIAIGTLGIVLALMGLFPGMTGLEPTVGIGIVQVMLLLFGFGMLTLGALIYVKFTFYLGQLSNLAQQIGIRLALTGLVFAAMAGLADILGFGTHLRTDAGDIFFGELQAIGILGSFAISSFGVLLYAVTGDYETPEQLKIVEKPAQTSPENDDSE